jgi:hypothetical protein
MSGHAGRYLVVLAAVTLLLAGCRGGAVGASDAGAPPATPVSAPTGTVAGGPDPARLADVESTLDQIERELERDGER